MVDLEHVTCPFGHTETPHKLHDRPDWWLELPGEFAWYSCPTCDVYFLNPRPTLATIESYYPDHYTAYRPAIADEKWALMRWKRRRNLRASILAVTKHAPPGRLLDVGCATGNFLAEMEQTGWQVVGVELNAEAAAYARQRFGFDIFSGDLLESPFAEKSFDAVTLWDVLEHTHQPLAVLQEAQQLLRPGGLLVFSVPDPNAVWAGRFGPAWIGYDAPRHLHLFHGENLHLLLSATGFSLLDTTHFLATYHTWVASFHTWLNRRLADGRLRRALLRLAYLPLWAPLFAPYFAWLNRRGRGTVLTVLARAVTTP